MTIVSTKPGSVLEIERKFPTDELLELNSSILYDATLYTFGNLIKSVIASHHLLTKQTSIGQRR